MIDGASALAVPAPHSYRDEVSHFGRPFLPRDRSHGFVGLLTQWGSKRVDASESSATVYGDNHEEDLLADGDYSRPRRGLSTRWRRYGAVAIALVAGLLVGGYGGHRWLTRTPPETNADLTASVNGPHALYLPHPPYRIILDLHNGGSAMVTIRQATMKVAGYESVLGMGYKRRIPPGKTETIIYGVRPLCDRSASAKTASVRLRARKPGKVRAITLHPSLAGTQIRTGHAILCQNFPPRVSLVADTVGSLHEKDGRLLAKLRLSESKPNDAPGTETARRLLRIDLPAPGIELVGLPTHGSPALPTTVEIQAKADDCGQARRAAERPLPLRVAFTARDGPHRARVPTDADFGMALRTYVESACGGG